MCIGVGNAVKYLIKFGAKPYAYNMLNQVPY